MSLSIPEQIRQLIQNKKHILVTIPKNPSGDAIASAIGLFLFLKKQNKMADIICDGFIPPQQFSFLEAGKLIQPGPSHLQKFILTIDIKEAGVEELSYDLKNDQLRIFVTPKKGFLTRDHVRTAQTDFKYDLMFVLGAEDLASLGNFYDRNTELFYKTPVVNIDHHAGNERFGQVQYIDLTVASTAEVVFDLLKKIGEEFIDAPIATALLAGMIAETRSFKHDNVKPHTLATAGKLMAMGADREKIVANLFRTRSIASLKLWGHALTHIQHDTRIGLVWSTITRDDFVRCGATEIDLKDIIDELIGTSPEAKLTLLLHEHADTPEMIHGIFRVHTAKDAKKLLEPYHTEGTRSEVSFQLHGKTLKQAEEEITTHLQKILA